MSLLCQWMCVNKRVLFFCSFTLSSTVMDLEHNFTVGRFWIFWVNKMSETEVVFLLTDLVLRGWVTTSSSLDCANSSNLVCCVSLFKVDLVSSLSNKVKFIHVHSCLSTMLPLSENKERLNAEIYREIFIGNINKQELFRRWVCWTSLLNKYKIACTQLLGLL